MQKIMVIILIFSFLMTPCVANSAPDVSALSAVVIENSTGRIIYEKNPHDKLPMASTTKIMTALCAIENSSPQKLVQVDKGAVGIEGSSIYLAYDEVITMGDLIYGTMLNSGNDAATAIAFEISGNVEEFAKLMNNTAKRIGANNTNFVNACGLWESEHYTTAYDLALISAYALENPFFAEVAKTKEKTISNGDKSYKRQLKNHNKLLSMYDGCIGVKTGYTKKCGRCLVSAAKRDGVTLTCVTLNAPDDWNDHKNLLDYGFSKVKNISVAKSGEYALSVEVENGTQNICPLEFKEDLSFSSISNQNENVTLSFDVSSNLKAPISHGQCVGVANLIADDKIAASSKLLCMVSVPEKPKEKNSVFWESIKSYFKFFSVSYLNQFI